MKYNPPAGSQDPDAKYVTGQPGKVRGSAVPAEAVEHPQREIVEVIKQAGLEPSGDDLTQLWQAISSLISKAAPGLATTKEPGLVQIGGGLSITAKGLLSVLVATLGQNGIMRPDGTTCTVEGGVLKVLQQSSDDMEAWRTSWIGVPRYWRSTELPDNHCWANGDAVLFADWPELKAVYDAGGFDGLLLPWDADGETQAANLGRWRPDALNPTGLYTPNLSGQFLRSWGPGEDVCGKTNKPGLPNIVGNLQATTASPIDGAFRPESMIRSGAWQGTADPWRTSFDASRCSSIYGASDTVMPPSVNQPVCLYLGRPAQIEVEI